MAFILYEYMRTKCNGSRFSLFLDDSNGAVCGSCIDIDAHSLRRRDKVEDPIRRRSCGGHDCHRSSAVSSYGVTAREVRVAAHDPIGSSEKTARPIRTRDTRDGTKHPIEGPRERP